MSASTAIADTLLQWGGSCRSVSQHTTRICWPPSWLQGSVSRRVAAISRRSVMN